jgi:hypothetical protein
MSKEAGIFFFWYRECKVRSDRTTHLVRTVTHLYFTNVGAAGHLSDMLTLPIVVVEAERHACSVSLFAALKGTTLGGPSLIITLASSDVISCVTDLVLEVPRLLSYER